MHERDFVRGRTFGIKGNIRKAVVLKREGNMITWTFGCARPLGKNTVQELLNYCDWVGDVDMGYLSEAELHKA